MTKFETPPFPPAMAQPRVELKFLDGLRGLAAFYVLIYHLYNPAWLPHLLTYPLSVLRFGHYAVGVFIVLSGYCLMLPVARSADGRIPGGVMRFFQRRSRRILPPYYAALVLSLVLLLMSRRLMDSLGIVSTDKGWAGNFSAGSILSHVFLVHNWNPKWNGAIDAPLWSVATEWQIYFLFPLLLLPAWRRLGDVGVVLTGLVVGVAPLFLLPRGYNFSWACPQYLCLFAMGMAGAGLGFSEDRRASNWRDRLPWGVMCATSLLAFASIAFYVAVLKARTNGPLGLPVSQPWAVDVLVGFSTTCLIIFCANHSARGASGETPWALRLLASRFAVALGAFSYSLYLVQLPLINVSKEILSHYIASPMTVFFVLFCVVLPFILGLSFLFHLAFERPFLSGRAKQRVQNDLQSAA